jgi:hypothetical protein
MMYLILSEMDYSKLPVDTAERWKILMPFGEMIKKDMDSGELLMYGSSPSGRRGFMVSKQSPKEIYAKLSLSAPYVKTEVLPMLSLDEVMEVAKEMQK